MSHHLLKASVAFLLGTGWAWVATQAQPAEPHYRAARAMLALGANEVARRNLDAFTRAFETGKRSAALEAPLPARPPAGPIPPPIDSLLLAAAETERQSPVVVEAQSLPSGPAAPKAGEIQAMRELLTDLPHVTVESRGGRLTLGGWTGGAGQRKLLDKVLAGRSDVLDLTTDDNGDPHRLLEVDATIFKILGFDSQSAGHNVLRRVGINASMGDAAMASFSWIYSAAISYEVNIANASEQRVAVLPRPHLTTLSGTPAKFTAGGDILYTVSGLNSGDIKPHPLGTTLEVTPTLLRTRGEDACRGVRGVDLASDDLEFELLGTAPKRKK